MRMGGYVARTVGGALLLVMLVILGLDVIAAVVDQLDDLQGGYTFVHALTYVGLSVPARLYEYLPFVALVGCLAGLGALAGSSELVAMRAAGMSVLRLSAHAIHPALWLTLLGLVVAEFVAPHTQQLADSYRAQALREVASRVETGLWHREGQHFIHFDAVQPDGELYGITVYRFDERRRLESSLVAARASWQEDRWELRDGREARFGDAEVRVERFDRQPWEVALTPELLRLVLLDPTDLPISGLHRYAGYLAAQGLDDSEYRLVLWTRLLQPLAIMGLVLLAVSFVFGPLREATMGYRVFVGVLVGVVFNTSQDMLGPASLVFGFPPLLAALLPALVSGGAGLVLLRRAV